MSFTADTTLLNGRYKLINSPISATEQGQLWVGVDQEEWVKPYLIKVWPFSDAKPDDVQRALWDAELRTLYRVRSTPGSEESLLQLQNVGIDHDRRCFVMVFKTTGLVTLASVLAGERGDHHWLSGRAGDRKALWHMLGRIADGLALLHDQQVVHRSVSPASVFLDAGEGPESCRLGGFEWSVRLGRPAARTQAQVGWETPPEMLLGNSAFGPDADWFAFGMLVARCMLSIEHIDRGTPDPVTRYRLVLDHLAKAKSKLTPVEHGFIGQLIAQDPAIRPRHHSEIMATIREIIRVLREPPQADDRMARHIVVIDPHNRSLIDSCMERGLRDVLAIEPGGSFDPQRPEHVTKLLTFLYSDFVEGATITHARQQKRYLLSGRTVHLEITPATDPNGRDVGWKYAFCVCAREFMSTAAAAQATVPPGRIEFFSTKDMRAAGYRLNSAPSWDALLPEVDNARERRKEHERLREFMRITNQIDLLIRDAELFRCEVVHVDKTGDLVSYVRVKQVPRVHAPHGMFEPDGGMVEFLSREKSSGKQDSNRIQLCSPESESIAHRPLDPEWEVDEVDITGRTATLRPVGTHDHHPVEGDIRVLRTKGLGGQVLLIKRRKEAIDKLAKHTYLLESLASPGQVLMDSGPTLLPIPLTTDTVDPSKLEQIKKILAVRPIYTLQGPPGTGKTHMVAWLLREILEEDPVAQILITAQAHPAVDVLRAKVEQEAFKDVPVVRKPLAIRLRRAAGSPNASAQVSWEPGSEYQVTREILQNAVERLEAAAQAPPQNVRDRWLQTCRDMLSDLATSDAAVANEFRQLVKRSANITYSTTGDGDLAALAGEVSYDWSIVEEAGKAHGFELALPLFLGHRWLLIGDPKQLRPYLIEDYEKALGDLDATVQALESLDAPGALLDTDLIQSWRERTPQQRVEFGLYCTAWLTVFAQLHRLCSFHEHENGLLTGQHRMHPDIGALVSDVYYGGKLEHYTADQSTGAPRPGIKHGLSGVAGLSDQAIVWLDIPAACDDERAAERAVPRYRNAAEARAIEQFLRSVSSSAADPLAVAILSPYAQQVGFLKEEIGTADLRAWLHRSGLRFARDPRGAKPGLGNAQDGFFTVDSFQGNQAPIVVVSLVRNNTKIAGDGLGFLVDPRRLNVLLSRAERLLVLVGSWDFFRNQVSHVSRNPDEPSQTQHLALVIDRLETWFKEGKALRIPAKSTLLDDAPDH